MFEGNNLSAADALLEAQKIAFGPVVFQTARLLRDWGVFKLLQDKKTSISVEEISKTLGLSIYTVEILCESGFSMGALKLENEKYSITKIGYFLLIDEMTKVNMDFNHDVNYQGLFYLDEALKNNEPSGLHHTFSKEETIYPILSKLPPKVKKSWFNFDHFYSDAAFKLLIDIMSKKGVKKLLEPGGNTGKWAVSITKASPQTSVTILDHQGQIDVALINAKKNGVEDRVDARAIDLLDHSIDFPKGYDGVWMSQFLDCFSPSDIISILKRSKDALNEDGKVFIVEPFWDRQSHEIGAYCLINTSPYFTALANGTSKMYRAVEFESFVDEAGLKVVEEINGLGFGHTLMICEKK
ncbi:class I SAM-dependent methyltransferase [Sulfurimonas sp.]|uniref:class I SAM-dependent methyltransferase n=1 Tax=Sulfurimonas sp. TaxID=2022749 RepID=UPI002AB1788A|nr:class I SAM-dependent methyltransferase [Sulfurimonas sp.]